MCAHRSRFTGLLACAFAATIIALGSPVRAVDGVIEINQASVTAAGGFPYVISSSGSYRLTSDLDVPDVNTTGISITSANVSLDLNGFTLGCSSCAGAGSGRGIASSSSNVTVRNGTLQGTGNTGIELSGYYARIDGVRVIGTNSAGIDCGSHCSVANSTAAENTSTGIGVGSYGSVVNCTANENTGSGIGTSLETNLLGNVASRNLIHGIAGNRSLVADNVATGNGQNGIFCATCTVVRNQIYNNGQEGLLAAGSTGYGSNQIDTNNGGNLNPQVSGGFEIGVNVCGGDLICP